MLPKYGNPRLKFPKGEQRKFIERIFQKNGLRAEDLAKIVGVSPRTVRDWKNERNNISEHATDIFCKTFRINLPTKKKVLIESWRKLKFRVCVKGGLARYKKYGNFSTPDGRRRGGSKALAILRQRGIIAATFKEYLYPEYSESLAEFVGIMLGDGGITTQQATITLNSGADKKYVKFVSSLGKKLFGQKPRKGDRKDCKAICLRYSGLKFIEYLTSIGLKIGDKVKQQVKVPSWIETSNLYKIACLRGLMDTDGCIAKCTHKTKFKKYTYYNPCFTNASKPILKFVENTLISIGFHPSVTGRHVWLYNMIEARAYFDIVGSSNHRLLKFKEGIPNGSGDGSLNHIA